MTTVKNVYDYMDKIAPFNTQEEWDNSGLLIGDENSEVKTILVALDFTSDLIAEAKKLNADLIITHHPIFLFPEDETEVYVKDKLTIAAEQSGINVICSHTCLDIAENGVNYALFTTVGIKDFETPTGHPFLKTAEINKTSSFELVNHFAVALGGAVRYNTIEKDISKLAVSCGSGTDFLDEAISLGADALLTGDAKHHDFLYANENDILLIAAGHFETETIIVPLLSGMLREEFNDLYIICSKQKSPVKTYMR